MSLRAHIITALGAAASSIHRLLTSLSRAAGGGERKGGGDFTHRFSARFEEELGRLAGFYNDMAKKLKEPVTRYCELVERAQDSVLELDREGYIRYVNEAALAMAGRGSERVLRRHYTELVPSGSRKDWVKLFTTVLGGETLKDSEQAFNFREGLGPVEITALPVWKEEEITGVRFMLKDIREETRMMEELREARESAEETAEKLKKTVKELEEFALLIVRRELEMKDIKAGLKAKSEGKEQREESDAAP